MFLDADTDHAVRAIWERLHDAGIPSVTGQAPGRRPHVTLAVTERLAAQEIAALRTAIASTPLPGLHLGHLGAFTSQRGVLFLGVSVSRALLALHAAVHAAIPAQKTSSWPQCRPGVWIPHCTLAGRLDAADLGAAVAALVPLQPLDAQVIGVGAVEIGTGKTVALIAP